MRKSVFLKQLFRVFALKPFAYIRSVLDRGKDFWRYCSHGVWNDTRQSVRVNLIKTLNLSVKSFFNGDIQSRACAMTYRTMLAVVPALALVMAIGRGFGLQDVIQEELAHNISGNNSYLDGILSYVNSYLEQSANQGLFLGIGIVLLLWTLISLLSSVESTFNGIWGVKEGRSIWRKTTDYLAIFLILPVLMICGSGLSALLTSMAEKVLPDQWVSTTVSFLLDFGALLMTWLFFTGVYLLIPNTKVKVKNALVAGIIAGTAFLILQWLFISGQIYVSKYNAIYGSFAFIPLLLIWMQFCWVITLSGAIICYASQNIFRFNFSKEIAGISINYRTKILLAIMAVVVKRFEQQQTPPDDESISSEYDLPSSLTSKTINFLIDTGLITRVVVDARQEKFGLMPSIDPKVITVGEVLRRVRHHGSSDFIPQFNRCFNSVNIALADAEAAFYAKADTIPVSELTIEKPIEKNETIISKQS